MTRGKVKDMNGQLEPKFVDEVRQEFLPDVMGYRVLLTEWTDGKYTLNIYKPLSPYDEELIEDGEVEYESIPDEEAIQLIIEEVLESKADRSMQ
jgi:hypothetical protein